VGYSRKWGQLLCALLGHDRDSRMTRWIPHTSTLGSNPRRTDAAIEQPQLGSYLLLPNRGCRTTVAAPPELSPSCSHHQVLLMNTDFLSTSSMFVDLFLFLISPSSLSPISPSFWSPRHPSIGETVTVLIYFSSTHEAQLLLAYCWSIDFSCYCKCPC
jgi:hypothetical protein